VWASIQWQLEPGLSRRGRMTKARRVAKTLLSDWRTREKAEASHRRKRLRKLREIGIFINDLPKCFGPNLAL
jgi:hypothetical protein